MFYVLFKFGYIVKKKDGFCYMLMEMKRVNFTFVDGNQLLVLEKKYLLEKFSK